MTNTTNQAPGDSRQGTAPLWDDRQLLMEAEVIVVGRFGIEAVFGVLQMIRNWYKRDRQRLIAENANLQAAYDLRGVHLDAAHHHIATLERAIVVGGPTLRAIRDEIEGGNDE